MPEIGKAHGMGQGVKQLLNISKIEIFNQREVVNKINALLIKSRLHCIDAIADN